MNQRKLIQATVSRNALACSGWHFKNFSTILQDWSYELCTTLNNLEEMLIK